MTSDIEKQRDEHINATRLERIKNTDWDHVSIIKIDEIYGILEDWVRR